LKRAQQCAADSDPFKKVVSKRRRLANCKKGLLLRQLYSNIHKKQPTPHHPLTAGERKREKQNSGTESKRDVFSLGDIENEKQQEIVAVAHVKARAARGFSNIKQPGK
jgi:hypothetical protein